MSDYTIHHGDALTVLRGMADESVNCVVTSPPYWGLRDYGTATWDGGDAACGHEPVVDTDRKKRVERNTIRNDAAGEYCHPAGWSGGGRAANVGRPICGKCGARRIDAQLGLEPTPGEYVARMVEVFREVRRVLRADGTCWVNLGLSYASTGRSDRDESPGVGATQAMKAPGRKVIWKAGGDSNFSWSLPGGFKPKDMVPIPWMIAMALQADGWYLRQDIIWHKPNPMPESVTDRCTKAHEYLFLLTKSARYFYDAEAVKEPAEYGRRDQPLNTWDRAAGSGDTPKRVNGSTYGKHPETGRNRRSVWTIPTCAYPGAHFATFPPALVEPCVLAGCPERCCAQCGKAWVRVVEKTPYNPQVVMKGVRFVDDSRGDKTRRLSGKEYNEQVSCKTIGFSPTCTCAAGTVPGVVLDPFTGSGTTGEVALLHGRGFVGIELNAAYIELAHKRIGQALRPATYRTDAPTDAPLFEKDAI